MRRVSLGRLTTMFAWIGLTSVGGGRSACIYEALVVRRAWLTDMEFLPGLTLSQLLPGPTVSNLSVFLGNSLNGPAGAALALVAVLLPGALTILALGVLYFGYGVRSRLESALRGMGAAGEVLYVNTTRIARGALQGPDASWLAATTFAAVGPLRLNAVLVLLVAGAVSLWLNRPGRPHIAPRASAGESDAC